MLSHGEDYNNANKDGQLINSQIIIKKKKKISNLLVANSINEEHKKSLNVKTTKQNAVNFRGTFFVNLFSIWCVLAVTCKELNIAKQYFQTSAS